MMMPAISSSNVKTCYCCPFGYHIDLDFVNYCDTLLRYDEPQIYKFNKGGTDRPRRSQRQTLNVMLGLDNELQAIFEVGNEVCK